jgi:hypothetical protein
MLALTWRCDGSEGIKWFLRGINETGDFYGEIQFVSIDKARRKAATVSGRLSLPEARRMAELVAVVKGEPPPASAGSYFAALFERQRDSLANARRLFEYRQGDEIHSESARSLMELVSLVEQHLSPFYARIAQ